MPEAQQVRPADLVSELERLEQAVLEAARRVQRLSEERSKLEDECTRLREERAQTVDRLTQLIRKVDALRGDA